VLQAGVHALLIAVAAGTAATGGAPAHPPSSYRLEDVVISYRSAGGHDEERSGIEARGNGTGMIWLQAALEPGDANALQKELVIPRDEFIVTLNRLYSSQFFTMANEYCAPSSIRVAPDGRVSVDKKAVAEGAGESITVSIGAYKKKVAWCADAPEATQELRAIAELIRGLAP